MAAVGGPALGLSLSCRSVDGRRGIGKALVEECIRLSRDQNAAAFALHTTPYMELAQGMYERMGFVRVPEYDFHPRPEMTVMAYKFDLLDTV